MSAKSDINVIIFNFEALRTSHSECQPPMLQPLDYCAQVRLDLKRIVTTQIPRREGIQWLLLLWLKNVCNTYCIIRHKAIFFLFFLLCLPTTANILFPADCLWRYLSHDQPRKHRIS